MGFGGSLACAGLQANTAFTASVQCAASGGRISPACRSVSQRDYAAQSAVCDDPACLADDDHPKNALDAELVLQQVCDTG